MGAWIETDIALLSSAGFTVSRPAWARGLKQSMLALINKMFMVAPRMGAWIETDIALLSSAGFTGRAPHGRVD